MSFNGWAVQLNGLMLTTCGTQTEWDDLDCAPVTVLDALTEVPAGLDLPSLRTEDVTYFQRDGVKHFNDWYEPRIITVVGVLNEDTGTCVDGDCATVREQLQELVQAWKRTCCDGELVVFPDCYSPDLVTGTNVYPDGTFDVDEDGWTGTNSATVARVTTPVHTGAGSLEITWGTDPVPYDDPTSTGQSALGAIYNAAAGDRYRVTAWVYSEETEPALVLGVSDTGNASGEGLTYSEPSTADGTWYQLTADYVVPDSGVLVPFIVNGEATTTGQLGYVDDVEAFIYTPVDRSVSGPFGVVGRPREFKYAWDYNNTKIVRFVARFDAVDHRMYVLDECGTEGYAECVTINPGTQLFSVCLEDGVCFTGAGFCFDTPVESFQSVPPEDVLVQGTERVFPTIVLQPNLVRPYVENLTTGEFISYNGTVGDLPVTINTEEGTAFDSEGNSLTHLLGGSLFLSMEPGNYQWRLLASGIDVPSVFHGSATMCWRNTVVNA